MLPLLFVVLFLKKSIHPLLSILLILYESEGGWSHPSCHWTRGEGEPCFSDKWAPGQITSFSFEAIQVLWLLILNEASSLSPSHDCITLSWPTKPRQKYVYMRFVLLPDGFSFSNYPPTAAESYVVTHCLTSLGADLHISSFMLYLLLLWSRRFPAVQRGMSSERIIPAPAALHGALSDFVYRLGSGVSSKDNKAATKPWWIYVYNLPPDSHCLNPSTCWFKGELPPLLNRAFI